MGEGKYLSKDVWRALGSMGVVHTGSIAVCTFKRALMAGPFDIPMACLHSAE